MFYVWKSNKPKAKRYKKEVVYSDPQDFDVKCIYVHLVMVDGRTFRTKVYGQFQQYVSNSDYLPDSITVNTPSVTTALFWAQNLIKNLSGNTTYVNDDDNPTSSIVGQAASASIDMVTGEMSCVKQFCVASIVKKEVNG